MAEGKRKRRSFADLVEGQKVAIRYFGRNHLSVADEIFMVPGPFEPEVYQRKLVKKKKPAEGAKSESKEAAPKAKEAAPKAEGGGKKAGH